MKDFLKQKLKFDGDSGVYDEYGEPVMVDWEDEWMEESAKVICSKGGRILNIGYGLGIIDRYIQTYDIKHHTIIEPHPDIHKKMIKDGWFTKPNVTVLPVEWQEVNFEDIGTFDGIFFDAYYIADQKFAGGKGFLEDFIPMLSKMLNPNGVFSFWPGPIFESFRASHKQFRNNLMKGLQPTFQLEKKKYKYSDTELNRKRLRVETNKNYTIPVITYREIPLKQSMI